MAEADPVLTDDEKAALEAFRQQMANPHTEEANSVVNESLGINPANGTKIQFAGGKEGWKPEPAPRGFARFQARERRRLEATEASKRRAAKNRKSVLRRISEAQEKLDGRNVSDTIALIEMQSPQDREIYILAEERGEARKGVLNNAGFQVTRKMREALAAELAVLEEVQSAEPVEPLILK